MIACLVALASIVLATVVTVFIVGIVILIAGVAEVINALQVKSRGKFLLWVFPGALYIVAGFVTFESVARCGHIDGIDLVFAGAGWIGVGLGSRSPAFA